MIKSASFRNFKSLRHVDVGFERLTVLVGPNASGKTSILGGLYLLSQVGSANVQSLFSGLNAPSLLYSRGVTGVGLELGCSSEEATIRLTMNPPRPFTQGGLDSWSPHIESRVEDGTWSTAGRDWLQSHFGSVVLLQLNAAKLAEASYIHPNKLGVKGDGEGLASVLALMALNQPDRFQELQKHLQSVIPTVNRLRFSRVPVTRTETEVVTIDNQRLTRDVTREHPGDQLIFDFQGASDIPGQHVSEGTILALGLITAMIGPNQPRLLLLDDLEHGLHPKAQRQLIPLFRKILEDDPGLQIIATTHSPYILDELDPSEVRITWANHEGVTQCARLDNHPDFKRWKDELWPGEFWGIVGEQWVGNGEGRESRFFSKNPAREKT